MAVLTVGAAVSGKSTCRASGKPIPKGSLRVGVEAYVGGRVVQTWQLPRPFLEASFLEVSKHSSGRCKATGYQFKKGDARFVVTSRDKRVFLTLQAAAEELIPLLKQVPEFDPLSFKGLDALTAEQREEFKAGFGISRPRSRSSRLAARELARRLSGSPEQNKYAEASQLGSRHQQQEDGAAAANATTRGHLLDIQASQQKEGDGNELEIRDGGLENLGRTVASEKENVMPNAKSQKLPDPSSITATLSAYEKARAEQMARNKERLMALQLPSMIAGLAPKTPARPVQPRGLPVKRKREELPRRMSLRQRGVPSDGLAVAEELPHGKVVVVNGEHIRYGSHTLREPTPPKDRHPKGDLPFKGEDTSKASDDAWLHILRSKASQKTTFKHWDKSTSTEQLASMQLRPEGVSKVTRDGMVHLAFHPMTQRLLLAAGDKSGHVGLWKADHPSLEHRSEDGNDSDVLELHPHYSYISGLRWAGGNGSDTRLFTASYDGSVRILDPAAETFTLAFSGEDAELSAMDVMADGRSGFIGDKDGNLELLDFRSRRPAHTVLSLHDRKINTLHVEPGEERLLVSSSADNTVQIWDLRQLGPGSKALARGSHSQTCQSAYWAPDGSKKVLTTSRDNTLRVWDGGRSMAQLLSIPHNNFTGRWTTPFRATWGNGAQSIIVGNLKRLVDVYDAVSGKLVAGLTSENMTAICSRQTVHSSLAVMASCTGSGRMYLWI